MTTTAIDVNPLVDLELERTVLGQMLQHNAYGLYVESGLERRAFYRGVHGLVFEAIGAVDARGEAPDVVSVWQELKRKQTDDAVGAAYFGKLTDGIPAPGPANALALTARLEELSALRLLREAAERLEYDVRTQRDVLQDGVVAAHIQALEAVLQRTPDAKAFLPAKDQLAALERDYARDRQGKVWFGLPQLDDAITGCRAGEVCGIMARPGIGKTLLLGHIARVNAEADIPHVFFSLEMPAAQMVERIARTVYGLGRYELKDAVESGELDGTKYQRVFSKLVIVDTSGLSVAEMATRVRLIQTSLFRQTPIRLVTIDHLGLIGGDRRLSTYDRVSVQAREIKELAKRTNTTVVLAVQVNRDAGGDGSKELSLGAARDSGVVEEAMDYLIALRRLDQSTTLSPMERQRYTDTMFAKVVKNRHGMTGKELGIRFDQRTLKITEDHTLVAEQNDLARIAQARRA